MSDRRYDTPPKNRRALEQRLRNLIDVHRAAIGVQEIIARIDAARPMG